MNAAPSIKPSIAPLMTVTECMAVNGNFSDEDVDFMIGPDEMGVDGILADDLSEPVMGMGSGFGRSGI